MSDVERGTDFVGEWVVPIDPMDAFQCESCQ